MGPQYRPGGLPEGGTFPTRARRTSRAYVVIALLALGMLCFAEVVEGGYNYQKRHLNKRKAERLEAQRKEAERTEKLEKGEAPMDEHTVEEDAGDESEDNEADVDPSGRAEKGSAPATFDDTPFHTGMYVYLCKARLVGKQRDCRGCNEAINSLDVNNFKLGIVLGVKVRGLDDFDARKWVRNSVEEADDDEPEDSTILAQTTKLSVATCVWPDEEIAGKGIELTRKCEHVKAVKLRSSSMCVKPLSYRGKSPSYRGRKGFTGILKRAERGIYVHEMRARKSDATPETRETEANRMNESKRFVVQMSHDNTILFGNYAMLRTRTALRIARERADAMRDVKEEVGILMAKHERMKEVIMTLNKQIAEVGAETAEKNGVEMGMEALEGGCNAERDPERIKAAFGNLDILKGVRKKSKRGEYLDLFFSFAYFSYLLIEAGADLGVPGLGTMMEWVSAGAEVALVPLDIAIEALDEVEPDVFGFQIISDSLGYVRDAVGEFELEDGVEDELIHQGLAAEVFKSGVATFKDEAKAELETGAILKAAQGAKTGAKQVKKIGVKATTLELAAHIKAVGLKAKQQWKKVVKSTCNAAKSLTKASSIEAGIEMLWVAGARMLPLIGPYVSLIRHSHLLFLQLREAQKSGAAYMESKDKIYQAIFSMRDCGMTFTMAYNPDVPDPKEAPSGSPPNTELAEDHSEPSTHVNLDAPSASETASVTHTHSHSHGHGHRHEHGHGHRHRHRHRSHSEGVSSARSQSGSQTATASATDQRGTPRRRIKFRGGLGRLNEDEQEHMPEDDDANNEPVFNHWRHQEEPTGRRELRPKYSRRSSAYLLGEPPKTTFTETTFKERDEIDAKKAYGNVLAAKREVRRVRADIMSLTGAFEAAMGAFRANANMREQITQKSRFKDWFRWSSPRRAHELDVVTRVSVKAGVNITPPNEWATKYGTSISKACIAMRPILAINDPSYSNMCCDEACKGKVTTVADDDADDEKNEKETVRNEKMASVADVDDQGSSWV